MNRFNPFQIILLVIFGFVAIIAVLVFGGFLPGFRSVSGGSGGTVVVWGPLSAEQSQNFWAEFNKQNEKFFKIEYVYKDPNSFENDLTEALAEGSGPDLVFIPQDLLIKQSKKLLSFSYSTISERDFRDTYFDGAEVLLKSQSIAGLPIWVDPLMMFYNKDLLSTAGLTIPPGNWSAFLLAQKALTQKDPAGNLLQTGVALGEPTNIKNAKDILTTLFFQVNEKIIFQDVGSLKVTLGTGEKDSATASQAVLQFFTQFVDPNSATYSWNRSWPEAQSAFAAGKLALYFGFGSEAGQISAQNPHLYFDVAMLPQRDKTLFQATYGRMTVLAVTTGSQKPGVASQAALALSAAGPAKKLADLAGASPTRRDLLSVGDKDPIKTSIYRSAFVSRSWNDPDPVATKRIFYNAIDSMNIGRSGASEAISSMAGELKSLIQKNGN